jgi:hypothetical protein
LEAGEGPSDEEQIECSTLAALLFLATAAFGQAGVSLIAGGTVVTMGRNSLVK